MNNKYSRDMEGNAKNSPLREVNEVSECKVSKKRIKDSIAINKDDIDLLRELISRDLIDYNQANQAIGRAYMNIQYSKEELKSYKKQGK